MTGYVADPLSVLDYTIDWATWLDAGETVTASTWNVPAGITQTTPAPSFTATTASIWLTGGTLNERYMITNHITTSAGRQHEESFTVTLLDL